MPKAATAAVSVLAHLVMPETVKLAATAVMAAMVVLVVTLVTHQAVTLVG